MKASKEVERLIEAQENHIDNLNEQVQDAKNQLETLRLQLSEALEVEQLAVGVDVMIVSIEDKDRNRLITTSEGFKWWDNVGDAKIGKHRITKSFYQLIKECAEKKEG